MRENFVQRLLLSLHDRWELAEIASHYHALGRKAGCVENSREQNHRRLVDDDRVESGELRWAEIRPSDRGSHNTGFFQHSLTDLLKLRRDTSKFIAQRLPLLIAVRNSKL